MAKISALLGATAQTGQETFPLVQKGSTRRATLAQFGALMATLLPAWYKGEAGLGASNNTVATLAQLKAFAPANLSATLTQAGLEGAFVWTAGNFTGFANDRDIVAADGTALSVGAWVRIRQRFVGGNRVDFMGDSNITENAARAPSSNSAALACYFSDGRMLKGLNAAIPGATTNGMLGIQLPQILNNPLGPPAVCGVGIGTNDIATGYDAIEPGITVEKTRANIAVAVFVLRAIGTRPVLFTIPPRNVMPTGNPAPAAVPDVVAKTQRHNAWLKRFSAENKVDLVDVYSVLADPVTGQYRAGLTDDGVHWNFLAQPYVAKAWAAAIAPLLPAHTLPLVRTPGDSRNLSANGLFLSDANADGVPDSWTGSGLTNLTAKLIGATSAFGKAFRIANAAEGPGSGTYRTATRTTGFAVGDRLGWGFKVISNGPGAGAIYTAGAGRNPQSIRFMVKRIYVGATSNGTLIPINTWSASFLNTGTVWTEDVVPPGTTGFYDEISTDFCIGTLDFAQWTTRNLTAL